MNASEAKRLTREVQSAYLQVCKKEILERISSQARNGKDFLKYQGAQNLLGDYRRELLTWLEGLGYCAHYASFGDNQDCLMIEW